MPKSILIADDSESIRALLSSTLRLAGYTVVATSDGEEAIGEMSKHSIDMVITDLNMPKIDGIGVVKEVRAMDKYKFIPVILLTTESQKSKKALAKEAGATGWIVKPFVESKLLEVVQKVLR